MSTPHNAKSRQKLRDEIKSAQDKIAGRTEQDERTDILSDLIKILSNELRRSWFYNVRREPTTKVIKDERGCA